MRDGSHAQAGFTLAEVMAALAVFSIAALAMLHLAAENVRAAGAAREHTFAGLLAENLMVEAIALPEAATPGVSHGTDRMDGRDWDWTRIVRPGGEPGLWRVDVEVRAAGEKHVRATLTGFRSGQ